jgi:hypothetical protein
MARLRIRDTDLVIRLNPLEMLMGFRGHITVPLAAIRSLAVVEHPLTPPSIVDDVTMGFAASAAPNRTTATVFPRARYHDGRAGICVWFNAKSIAIELDARSQPWSLLVVSTPQPHETAAAIRRSQPA